MGCHDACAMSRSALLLIFVAAACGGPPAPPVLAPPPQITGSAVAAIDAAVAEPSDPGFGSAGSNGLPDGWSGGPAGTVALADDVQHAGHRAVRLARTASSADAFSSVARFDPFDAAGSTLELRGYLRTQDVHGFAGLWLREDGDDHVLAFDNMAAHPVAGTTEWAEYSITLHLQPEATRVAWGVLLTGDGTAWAADLRLVVDGAPIARAPHATRALSVVDRDHEFDAGSRVAPARPTAVQIDNLVTLAKVWGFLKYHHPAITSGTRHWDYELLRVLPRVLDAHDRAAANALLVAWIAALGELAPCQPCATVDGPDLASRADLAWLDDKAKLGGELSAALHAVYDHRVPGQQFYVSLAAGAHNADLHHELRYAGVAFPDGGFQLLGLFRLWTMIEYWAPDRALADAPWDRVLADAIPSVMAAASGKDYHRALALVITHIHDGHAGLRGAPDAEPPDGDCVLPLELRFVGATAVVSKLAGDGGGLAVGDELVSIGGTAIAKLVATATPYYSASNESARRRDLARGLVRGDCATAAIDARRAGRAVHASLARVKPAGPSFPVHDRAGAAFQLLSADVAYLKLSSVVAAECPHYIEQAAHTKGLIVDLRNYPSEFVVFALGELLVTAPTPFVRFTTPDLSNPGAFRWTDPVELEPAQPHYAGKVVVLVDEVSQSQAEYTTMALRAAGAVVIGSQTAGADGNVTEVPLPGAGQTYFSGLGVFYPDRTPTQGIGIVPDVRAVPTVAGLRDGRDEVLDAGIRAITGSAH
jgi:C-terminal processing protease CtpA/Prc